MAPKGLKRTPSSATAPPAKKQKTIAGFAKKCDKVTEALHQVVEISDSTRKMLINAFPRSIEQPKDERHPLQMKVVAWVQEMLASVEADVKKSIEAVEADYVSKTSKKDACQAAQDTAKAEYEAKCEVIGSKRTALADSESKLAEAQLELKSAAATQQEGDKQLNEIAKHKNEIEQTAANVTKLKVGAVTPDEAKALLQSTSQMGSDMQLDQSMIKSLPGALGKTPDLRGQFDIMVITSFEDELKKRIASFTEKLADGEPAKQERAAKVEVATATVEACKHTTQTCKEELDAALAAKDMAQTASKESIIATKLAVSELKAATANLNEANKNLIHLEKGAMADLKELDEWDGKPKGSQYKTIGGIRYERDLLEMTGDEEISMEKAEALFEKAMDGNVVTATEKRTLRYILKNKGFVGDAKNFLETKMGTSWYQSIDGVQYERTLLTIAAAEASAGPLGKESAEKLWNSAQDGQLVTACEKRTLKYILEKNEFAEDAKTWLEESLAAMLVEP